MLLIEDVLTKNLNIENLDELNRNELNPLTFSEYINHVKGSELELNREKRRKKSNDPGTRPKLPSQLIYLGFSTKGFRNIYQILTDNDLF